MMLRLIPRLDYRINLSDWLKAAISVVDKNKLEPNLTYFFGDFPFFFYNHGRNALISALSILNLPTGSKVGVMAFNCHTVFNSIIQARLQPEFIDITAQFTIDFTDLVLKVKDLKVLIITHLFGIVNDVKKIKLLYPELIIIEDCAHSFLSANSKNEIAGRIGDMAVFSFNRAKFPMIGGGGCLIVVNPVFVSAASVEHQVQPELPLFLDLLSFGLRPFLQILHYPFVYKCITFPIKCLLSKRRTNAIKKIKSMKISKRDYSFLLLSLGKLIEKSDKQKKQNHRILEVLNSNFLSPADSNGFMVPFLYTGNRKDLLRSFRKNGIELGTHFSNSILWAKECGYFPGSCPVSEKIAMEIVTVPCYNSMTEAETNQIIRQVKELKR